MDLPTAPDKSLPFLNHLRNLKERLSDIRRIPVSTYRMQFNRGFTFQDARAIVSYLSNLGISHCYSSPYLASEPGSTHGYDVSDYTRLNPEIGSEEDLDGLIEELKAHGMGHISDFVPNHMGITCPQNQWWQDVLENGRCSAHAGFFDIDWNPVKAELKGKVLLPILGDQYGRVLERGELVLKFQEGRMFLSYFDHLLPIDPASTPRVLAHNLEKLQGEMGEDDPHLMEFLSIITALNNLPAHTESDAGKIRERIREKEVTQDRLTRLLKESPRIRRHLEENLKRFNGIPGHTESFDPLHELLEQQAYRLSYWRTASHEINYRRFFDINHLAGIRMERPEVFEQAHTLILRLIGEGKVTGLRLDHPDGLFQPAEYFDRLQTAVLFEYARRDPQLSSADPDKLSRAIQQWRRKEEAADPSGPVRRPLFLVIEKILTGPESVRTPWAVHGTSGYDFLNDVNELFVDSGNERAFDKIYIRYTGQTAPLGEIIYESKKLIMRTSLASELNVLVRALNRISEEDRHSRDFTLNSLREALIEVVACFPIYRTYMDRNGYTPEDRETLENAIARARGRNPALEPTIFEFLKETLLLGPNGFPESRPPKKQFEFILKLQQFTGPVQAKGLEDTAFYRYNRLISLNEVGGNPQRFGLSPAAFHIRNQKRQKEWPWTLTATATHDHKRGEDVRARLNILSEIPDEWRKAIRRWSLLNRSKRTVVEGENVPDRNDEYLFYQTLVGMWPVPSPGPGEMEPLVERLQTYMHKAAKEAKVHSSWIHPNEAYDEAVKNFIRRVLTPSRTNRFLDSFLPFQQRVARMGMINSLAQVLLKITSPGIPDFYQGTELWDLSLVDPDNRKPVDFQYRRRLLEEMAELLDAEGSENPGRRIESLNLLLESWEDGRIKMFVTASGLRFRRQHPELFLQGDYLPLPVEGERADHVVAFARQANGEIAITVVPRLITGFMQPDLNWPAGPVTWGDTRIQLPAGLPAQTRFRDVFTHQTLKTPSGSDQTTLALKDIFRDWPLALLAASSRDPSEG